MNRLVDSSLADGLLRTSAVRACANQDRPGWVWPTLVACVYVVPALIVTALVAPWVPGVVDLGTLVDWAWRGSNSIGAALFIPTTLILWILWGRATNARGGLAAYILVSPAAVWPYMLLLAGTAAGAAVVRLEIPPKFLLGWPAFITPLAAWAPVAAAILLAAVWSRTLVTARRIITARGEVCRHCGHPLPRARPLRRMRAYRWADAGDCLSGPTRRGDEP